MTAVDLSLYKTRYQFDGDKLKEALWLVGDNHVFELEAQPKFMKNQGLLPEHMFLDFGCGCLRGSAPLVDYLEEGHFHGADISDGLLKMAKQRVLDLGITKSPVLWLVNNYDLKNEILQSFDFILSVSVFTHILPDIVGPLFHGIHDILKENGIYYFTCYPLNDKDYEGDIEIMKYRKEFLIERGREAGLLVEDIKGDFPNPSPMSNYINRVNVPPMAQWVMKATHL